MTHVQDFLYLATSINLAYSFTAHSNKLSIWWVMETSKGVRVLHCLSNKRVQSYCPVREEETLIRMEYFKESSASLNLTKFWALQLLMILYVRWLLKKILWRKREEISGGVVRVWGIIGLCMYGRLYTLVWLVGKS